VVNIRRQLRTRLLHLLLILVLGYLGGACSSEKCPCDGERSGLELRLVNPQSCQFYEPSINVSWPGNSLTQTDLSCIEGDIRMTPQSRYLFEWPAGATSGQAIATVGATNGVFTIEGEASFVAMPGTCQVVDLPVSCVGLIDAGLPDGGTTPDGGL